jgi:hypothetical protein
MQRARMLVVVVVVVLVAAVGCGTDYAVVLSPRFDRALGHGLTVDVYASVEACSVDGFDEEICSLDQADGFDVAIVDGAAIRIGPSEGTYSNFAVTGIAIGSSTLSIDGDHAGTEVEVAVRPVATTDVFVERWGGYSDLPVERSPVAAFAGSNDILLGQVHHEAGGATLLGHAAWSIDPGPTGSALGPYRTLAVGPTLGRAKLTTAVGGELVVDVVDATAIATMEILQGWTPAVIDELELPVGSILSIYVSAHDATGRAIVGWGPTPAIAVAPAMVVELVNEERYGHIREITVHALAPGAAVAQITWGPRTAELALTVVP